MATVCDRWYDDGFVYPFRCLSGVTPVLPYRTLSSVEAITCFCSHVIHVLSPVQLVVSDDTQD